MLGDEHDVERGAVAHEDLALAVEEGAARRGEGHEARAVVLRQVAEVARADHLQVPELDDEERRRAPPPGPAGPRGGTGRPAGPRRSSPAASPAALMPDRCSRRSTRAKSSPPARALRVAREARATGERPAASTEKTEASHCTRSASATVASRTTRARAAVVAIRKRPAAQPHGVADEQLREGREPQHAPAEEDVLDPARGGPREHAVGLAAGEGAVDDHEKERVEVAAGSRHEVAERRLDEDRPRDGEARPERAAHSTDLGVSRGSFTWRTTRTSSRRSKRAEGSTRMSRKRPDPFPTNRTRPTTRPLG